jgi:hypothetical protein
MKTPVVAAIAIVWLGFGAPGWPQETTPAKPGPESASSRFVDNNDQTITDAKSGLTWTKDSAPAVANSPDCGKDAVTWEKSDSYVACLNVSAYAGHKDWRVPTLWEIASLCNQTGDIAWLDEVVGKATSGHCNRESVIHEEFLARQGFTNIQSDKAYWSSTHYSASTGTTQATAVSVLWAAVMIDNGGVFAVGRPAKFAVWPVRGGK